MSRAGSTYPFFFSPFRSPPCLRNGQLSTFSTGGFRYGHLEFWRYFCSVVSVIHHNQALSRRPVDLKRGMLLISPTAMENHSGTRQRGNSFAISATLQGLFCPTSSHRT